jgi:hypothetical protein
MGRPGALELLALEGMEVPGLPSGTKVRNLFPDWSQPVLDEQGDAFFVATLEGPEIDINRSWSIWRGHPGDLRLLVRAGEPAAGMPDGVAFGHSFLGANDVRPVVSRSGLIAFRASVSGDLFEDGRSSGVWGIGADERVRLVVGLGDDIEVAPGDVRTVTGVSRVAGLGGQIGPPPSLNDRGELVVEVDFLDSSSAILLATLPVPVVASLGATADTYVDRTSRHANEGASSTLRVGGRARRRTLIEVDVESLRTLVAGGEVQSARLELEMAVNEGGWRGDARGIAVHRMISSWREGNGATTGTTPTRGSGAGATWVCAIDLDISDRSRDCQSPWRMSAPSNHPLLPWQPMPSDELEIDDEISGTISFDVTADVQAALSEDDELSWVLLNEERRQPGEASFLAREAGASGPRLAITFIPGGPPGPGLN